MVQFSYLYQEHASTTIRGGLNEMIYVQHLSVQYMIAIVNNIYY